MILERFNDTLFQANCYVLAPSSGAKALVIDPGLGCSAWVKQVINKHKISIGAVLLTHGHADHCWDAAEVAGETVVYCPEPDLYRLEDPAKALGPELAYMFKQSGVPWRRPQNVAPLPAQMLVGSGCELLPGIFIRALPAPGHSEGSTVFYSSFELAPQLVHTDQLYLPSSKMQPVMFGGDVLFPMGHGRVDIPGSNATLMEQTLRLLLQVTDPKTIVIPGHGKSVTMAWMREHNPALSVLLAEISASDTGCACGGGGCGCRTDNTSSCCANDANVHSNQDHGSGKSEGCGKNGGCSCANS